jgi:uncharacterized membrane protein
LEVVVNKNILARVTSLAIFLFLASCSAGQGGSDNQEETVFTDPPMIFRNVASTLALIIEIIGIFAIVLAVLIAGFFFFRNLRRQDFNRTYGDLREHVGRGILIGLEFLVAADIIGTVAVDPTIENLGILGLVVLIRTFLSFAIEAEIHGRWPWQAASISSVTRGGEFSEDG